MSKSMPSFNRPSRWPYCVPAGCLLVSLYFAWQGLTAPVQSASTPPSTPASTQALPIQPIADIQLGQRVLGRNPLREQVDESLPKPDPATWRTISLHMKKADGLSLWVDLLRPVEWIEYHQAEPGATIHLDLPEMGAVGEAEVTSIDSCPEIKPGTGPIVTGRFIHEARDGEVIELRLADQEEVTRVTANHPYWSVDRADFIPAGELQPGEQVDTHYGTTRVVSLTPIAYTGLLYNLETTEHVYRVGSVGTLVHNSCPSVFLHGSDVASVDDIVRNGLNRAKAAELGGGDVFWALPESALDSARVFAQVNPRGGATAILKLELPERVGQSLIDRGLLKVRTIEDGTKWFEFSEEAWDLINEFGRFSRVM